MKSFEKNKNQFSLLLNQKISFWNYKILSKKKSSLCFKHHTTN